MTTINTQQLNVIKSALCELEQRGDICTINSTGCDFFAPAGPLFQVNWASFGDSSPDAARSYADRLVLSADIAEMLNTYFSEYVSTYDRDIAMDRDEALKIHQNAVIRVRAGLVNLNMDIVMAALESDAQIWA